MSRADAVGPVLESCEVSQALIAAMRETEPRLTVQDRGSYLRVSAPGRCSFKRAAVERILGRAFHLPGDLEALMPSFAGAFEVTSEEAVWQAREKR